MRSVEPLTVAAAGRDRRVRDLASRSAYNIGSYLGVPVLLGPGQLAGTLCVLDPEPHRFTGQDLDLLVVLSAWLRLSIKWDTWPERTEGDGETIVSETE